ncbi:hypothetical protein SAMN05216421_0608 [Halopseudomonas xinjiangensis]|uniref:Uncharacterized protein n=1 Tax=Halopseudomonas xinjiangensis TaxID=487184 RepID=A0A1H1N592_9GAMM|nr:hypothetical protein [Halopseudomonas xinjiangensis]SDR94040.1 hypothetical protein SAMN05216421_0608 [Halopseudomonas xinjiangensis]
MNGFDDDEESFWDPLGAGAAGLPPVLGGGCMARFDPASLNEESGADFSALSAEGRDTRRAGDQV